MPPIRVWEPDERPDAPELKQVLDPRETGPRFALLQFGFRSSRKALIVEPPQSISCVLVFSLPGKVLPGVLPGRVLAGGFPYGFFLYRSFALPCPAFFLTEASAIR